MGSGVGIGQHCASVPSVNSSTYLVQTVVSECTELLLVLLVLCPKLQRAPNKSWMHDWCSECQAPDVMPTVHVLLAG